ncbi:MAG: hypothetical protein JXR70_18695 [Spirochaetales bacterium]|nr:hypothetical protein [Spirochaetales bacterium]
MKKTNPENYYIINFLLDAWALILVVDKISPKKYKAEYNNLKDLYDVLAFSMEKKELVPCITIIRAIDFFKGNTSPFNSCLLQNVLTECDNFMYVNIYFRAGIIIKKLSMYHDLSSTGAFGYSPNIDLIKYLKLLSSNLASETIIDLGSGNGLPVCLFSHIINDVTGIELKESLVEESLNTIEILSKQNRINSKAIRITHGSFYNINLSRYSIIYICWPFDNTEKHKHEEEMKKKLALKIQQESKKGTIIMVYIPGMNEKDIFPQFKKIRGIAQDYSTAFCFYIIS